MARGSLKLMSNIFDNSFFDCISHQTLITVFVGFCSQKFEFLNSEYGTCLLLSQVCVNGLTLDVSLFFFREVSMF